MSLPRTLLSGLLAAAAATGLHAGGAASGQREPIRAGIDLVTVDFTALSPEGLPVADLAPQDVTLKVNGRAREIRSFQFVQVATPAAHAGDEGATRELAPPFGSNYVGDAGRTVILIVENESLRAGVTRHATDAAAAFVRDLSPRDRVALMTMPRGGLRADLTRDHAHVRQLIAGISGQGSQRTTEYEHACRTRETLLALKGLLEGLVSMDLPKTVVFISSGILAAGASQSSGGTSRDFIVRPGQCDVQSAYFEEVGSAAVAARANVYVIRPEDLVVDSAVNAFLDPAASRFRSTDEEMAGLESLAGVTSGVFLRMTPNDQGAFARVLRESSGYYTAAFEPSDSERNGLSHRVEVSVARPDATVRQRPRLTIPKPAARGSGPAVTPQAMLRDGRMYRDLPMRAAAYASAGDEGDSKLKIIALAEPLDRSTTLTSAAFALIDARGRLTAQWTANERELSRVPVMSAGLAPAGSYRLRVAALDNLGRRGATDYEFTAQLNDAGPVKLSALVAGVSRGGFLPRLQFVADPTATGMFEVYGSLPEAGAAVAFELAREAEGVPLVTVPAALAATGDPTRHVATGVVPLGAFAPGDYVLRGTLTIDGKPLGQVSRTIRKAVR